MFCKACGKEIADGNAFCSYCGASTVAEAPQSQYNQYNQYNQAQYGAPNKSSSGGFFSDFSIGSAPNEPGPNNGNVDFLTAIKLFFSNYTNFKGRASLNEYWWAFLFNVLVGFVPVIGVFLSLFCLVPGIAVCVRRLHDTGKSGAYYFMALIPIAGPIIFLVQMLKQSDGHNEYGPGNPEQMAAAQARAQAQAQQYAQAQQQYAQQYAQAQQQYAQAPAQQYAQPPVQQQYVQNNQEQNF